MIREYMVELALSFLLIIIAIVFGLKKTKRTLHFSKDHNKTQSSIKSEQYYSNLSDSDSIYYIRCIEQNRREQTPVSFSDGLSFDSFIKIAYSAVSRIKRIDDIDVYSDGTIYCDVKSNSGLSTWGFSLDFNEWGHITGGYWVYQDNEDSTVPYHVGQTISGMINAYYGSIGVTFPDYTSFAIDAFEKRPVEGNFFDRIRAFVRETRSRKKQVSFSASEMVGEHMDVVVGMLKNDGFFNIILTPNQDVDGENGFYERQVFRVSIDGNNHFSRADSFPKNASVEIHFHEKRSYYISRSQVKDFIGTNYKTVLEQLSTIGFKELHSEEKQDLYVGLLKKRDSTKDIYIMNKNGEKSPVVGGVQYPYDTKIIVEYHTYKHHL